MRYGRWPSVLLVVVLFTLAWPASGAIIPIPVGNGTAASCTETALVNAVTSAASYGGGSIRFRCGPGPVTIVLTATLTVPHNTTLDGGGVITLAGPFVGPLLFVDHDSTVVLKNVTITNFANVGGIANPGGSGVSNAGTLSIINSTFSYNDFIAIGNVGTLTIGNSIFSHNGHFHSESCSGIRNDGILIVSHSTFEANTAESGGAVCNSGTATINASSFSGNLGDLQGGAIYNAGGNLTVANSTFSDNTTAHWGGGIWGFGGAVTINSCTFVDNRAMLGGGGIGASGVVVIRNSVFSDNQSASGGGGVWVYDGQASISESQFTRNSGDGEGGALLIGDGTTVTIRSSVITGNSTTGVGGGIANFGTLTVATSLITRNTAVEDGGGIFTYPGAAVTTTLRFTVVRGNEPNDIGP